MSEAFLTALSQISFAELQVAGSSFVASCTIREKPRDGRYQIRLRPALRARKKNTFMARPVMGRALQ
jgi:hypothetical protein